jgi:nucleoside 2-deoxyribosyltransferase
MNIITDIPTNGDKNLHVSLEKSNADGGKIAKPRIYLAGKIAINDWRHSLVPNLRGHLWADGDIETNNFIYVGPYFVSCDHGCFHGKDTHGAVGSGCFGNDHEFTKQEVFMNNTEALFSADLVFAYITATDCHGTIMEIGSAYALGIPIVIAYAPTIKTDDFWYPNEPAVKVHEKVRECCLPKIFADDVQGMIRATIDALKCSSGNLQERVKATMDALEDSSNE